MASSDLIKNISGTVIYKICYVAPESGLMRLLSKYYIKDLAEIIDEYIEDKIPILIRERKEWQVSKVR